MSNPAKNIQLVIELLSKLSPKEKEIYYKQGQRDGLLSKANYLTSKLNQAKTTYNECMKSIEAELDAELFNSLINNELSSQQITEIMAKALSCVSFARKWDNRRRLINEYRELDRKVEANSKALIDLELELIALQHQK
ncbi:MAG: hypothetical protein WAQ98_31695 [Blastocatellia bacterium]